MGNACPAASAWLAQVMLLPSGTLCHLHLKEGRSFPSPFFFNAQNAQKGRKGEKAIQLPRWATLARRQVQG